MWSRLNEPCGAIRNEECGPRLGVWACPPGDGVWPGMWQCSRDHAMCVQLPGSPAYVSHLRGEQVQILQHATCAVKVHTERHTGTEVSLGLSHKLGL